MSDPLTIIDVSVVAPSEIRVTWQSREVSVIDLTIWIAAGGATLAALSDPVVFERARVGDYGSAVIWGDGDDLAIDAYHLRMLANEQGRRQSNGRSR